MTRCPKCGGYCVTVTLGGFLTIARCDDCLWWRVEEDKGSRTYASVHDLRGS